MFRHYISIPSELRESLKMLNSWIQWGYHYITISWVSYIIAKFFNLKKSNIMCLRVCLSVTKDPANRRTDLVIF